ncbi:glycine oxidase [Fodinibius salinus]|uniref:Glycine oxidase n=1 Tax=Fodinibius salinus TaxID=860790 RepID=A0A5D3YJ91_9BACT|nr:glycine oxidase ThiO [Fodinibius salinus]TYP93904.1 glycine oxidase [Fodinibius salinus]
MSNKTEHIAIIGGGIIGLGIGWQLVRRGANVTIFEKGKIGKEASWVAGGMLAPYAEAGFEEIKLMRFGEQSLNMYPRLLDELSEDTDNVPVLDTCGTLMTGIDRDDTEKLKRLYEFRKELELDVELFTGTEAREREPLLSPNVVSGLWLPDDAQIDNRKLLKAMENAFEKLGGTVREHTKVEEVEIKRETAMNVIAEEEEHAVDQVVVAAGCWSQQLAGIPGQQLPPIRPEKGQILTLEQTDDCPLKGIIRSPRMYLVPKEDGTIRLGATAEEKGFDKRPTAGAQKELLEHGWEMVPAIYELPLVETVAGLRPAGKDHRPIIGESDISGLYYATGHYRHGIMLMPLTVYALVNEILDEEVSDWLAPFRPQRFNAN